MIPKEEQIHQIERYHTKLMNLRIAISITGNKELALDYFNLCEKWHEIDDLVESIKDEIDIIENDIDIIEDEIDIIEDEIDIIENASPKPVTIERTKFKCENCQFCITKHLYKSKYKIDNEHMSCFKDHWDGVMTNDVFAEDPWKDCKDFLRKPWKD